MNREPPISILHTLPADPKAACAVLQESFLGWDITYQPDSFDGLVFEAWRPWPDLEPKGRSGVLAKTPEQLAIGLACWHRWSQ